MGKSAFVFPGQASQYTGMGKDLFDNFDAARKIFEEADQELGFSITDLCFDGPDEKLQLTEITQPAILTVSAAAFAALQQEGDALFDFTAGHSLGEYSALVAAGCISVEDAVVAVNKRGKYMQEAVPLGEGGMAAIIGMESEKIEELLHKIPSDNGLIQVANYNSPGQVVIAGAKKAVDEAVKILSDAGAKRALPLPVSAPFHTPMMKPAQIKLAEHFQTIDFKDFNVPLVTNVDVEFITTGEKARDSLIRQVSSPVRWEETVQKMIQNGVDTFVEVGPGKVLAGLIKRIDKSVRIFNIEDSKSLDEYLTR